METGLVVLNRRRFMLVRAMDRFPTLAQPGHQRESHLSSRYGGIHRTELSLQQNGHLQEVPLQEHPFT